MERILQCRFMRTLLRGQKRDYDPNYLLASYQEFKTLLLSISDDNQNYREKFRTIKSLFELLELNLNSSRFQNERGENIMTFAQMASRQVSVELELLEKQLMYPELFSLNEKTPQLSPLHWNHSAYTKTALMSLIVALDGCNACSDSCGNQASFISIVNTCESAFNIKLPNPYKMRDELLSQGDHRTKFIRQLLKALGSN